VSAIVSHPVCKNLNIKHLILYGCEIWSHAIKEDYRLRILRDKELRRKFGLKAEVIGG
jgi:hypothetical protein